VSATDAEADALTYSGTTATPKGKVIVNSSTGAFTYVPTATARDTAAQPGAKDADLTDSFTVTASDGYGGSAQIAIAVPISPQLKIINNYKPDTPNTVIGSVAVKYASGVAVGPDGRVYVARQNNSVSIIDNTGVVLATVSLGPVGYSVGVAVSPDGSRAYAFTNSGPSRHGYLSVIDTATEQVTRSVDLGFDASGQEVVVGSDGKLVYINTGYAETYVVDTTDYSVTTIAGLSMVGDTVNTSGSRIYFGGTPVKVYDTASKTVVATISNNGYPAFVAGAVLSPDDRTLYISKALNDGADPNTPGANLVAVIDTNTNTITATIPVANPRSLVVSPNGKHLYAITPGGVTVIDTAARSVVATIATTQYAQWLAISPDGSRLYVSDYSNGVSVIFTGNGADSRGA
jgi:YVTN family beta-propeller protein/VCBS repeat-containing protein